MTKEIVGTWENWMGPKYSFNNDGTYYYQNPRTGHNASGQYSIEGSRLNFITMGNVCEFSINGDKLTLYPPSGSAQEFERK